jgi:hypothetical protein
MIAVPALATHTPIASTGTATFPNGAVWDAAMTWGNDDVGEAVLSLHDPSSGASLPDQSIPAKRTFLGLELVQGQRGGCFAWDRHTFRIDALAPPLLRIDGVQEVSVCTGERHGHYTGTYLQVVALDLCQGNCLRF